MSIALYTLTSSLHREAVRPAREEAFIRDIETGLGEILHGPIPYIVERIRSAACQSEVSSVRECAPFVARMPFISPCAELWRSMDWKV